MISKTFYHLFMTILTLFTLLIISGSIFFYTSGLHKKIYFDTSNIRITSWGIKDVFFVNNFSINNFSINNLVFKADSIIVDGLIIYSKNDNKNKSGNYKKSFLIIDNILSHINIFDTNCISIKNFQVNDNIVLKSLIKNDENLNIITANNKELNFTLLSNNSIRYSLPNGISIRLDIKENYFFVYSSFKSNFLLSGKISIQENFNLSGVKFNKEFFDSTNIFNNLSLNNDLSLINDYITLNKDEVRVYIPWIKKDDIILTESNIHYNIKSKELTGVIGSAFIFDTNYKNLKFSFNLDTYKSFFKLNDNRYFKGQFFVSDKNEYYVNLDEFIFDDIKLYNEEVFILENGLSSSFVDIIFDKQSFTFLFKEKIDKFISDKYPSIFNIMVKNFNIHSLTDLNGKLFLGNKNNNFMLSNDFVSISIIKHFDDFIFSIFSKKIILSDSISLNKISITGSYITDRQNINFDSFHSSLKYKNIEIPLFFSINSSYKISTGELNIPALNDNFSVHYLNGKLRIFSNKPYILKNPKFGKIKLSNVNIDYENNFLQGKVIISESDIILTKKILDFITKDNIKKKYISDVPIVKDVETSEKLKYEIVIQTDTGLKKFSYPHKKISIVIDNINIVFKNEFLGGDISIIDGNFEFQNKNFKFKPSNINFLDSKVILSMNSIYQDDEIKINVGVFGNSNNNNIFINLTSEPSYNEKTLINYLLFNSSLEDDGNTMTADLLNVGIDKVKNFLNLPIDSIKLIENEEEGNTYKVSKKLSKDISVEYTKETGSNGFEIIYKINKHINFNSYTTGETSGVRFEWEYEY